MSATKHTPGPWAAWPIPNDRLKRLAVVCINDEHCPGTGKQVVACDIRTEHDARLVAAAPELLEALIQAVAWIEGERTAVNALSKARAAIAKATGTGEAK